MPLLKHLKPESFFGLLRVSLGVTFLFGALGVRAGTEEPFVAKRNLTKFGVSLDLPSGHWNEVGDIGPDFNGLAVCRGDVWVALTVEKLPGKSKEIMEAFTKDAPKDTKITRETLTTLGPFLGTGIRLIGKAPDSGRIECVLFYPSEKLSGYYIFTVVGGPTEPEYQSDLASIIQSLRKQGSDSDHN